MNPEQTAGAEEWRVEVELDDEAHGYSLGERLRALRLDDEARERLGERALVTRDGSRLFVYTNGEGTAREAERVIRELLADDRLSGILSVTRYHPVEGEWKDASVPLPRDDEEVRAEYERKEQAALRAARSGGELPWDVRVELESLEDAVALAESLGRRGEPVHRRWRHVVVEAPTEERANEIADELRSELPSHASTTVEAHGVRYPVFTLLGSAT